MYRDQRRYRGRWRPRRRFLGADRVPAFDGVEDGEEFRCAQAIDSLPGLRYWIRNVARDPASFSLPTATDRFYPDFVAQLEDGRRKGRARPTDGQDRNPARMTDLRADSRADAGAGCRKP